MLLFPCAPCTRARARERTVAFNQQLGCEDESEPCRFVERCVTVFRPAPPKGLEPRAPVVSHVGDAWASECVRSSAQLSQSTVPARRHLALRSAPAATSTSRQSLCPSSTCGRSLSPGQRHVRPRVAGGQKGTDAMLRRCTADSALGDRTDHAVQRGGIVEPRLRIDIRSVLAQTLGLQRRGGVESGARRSQAYAAVQ